MKAYFLRRLLLLPITLLGVTAIVFSLTRFVPGGPIEQELQKMNQGEEGAKSNSGGARSQASMDQLEELSEEFGYADYIPVAYCMWLGVLPREDLKSKGDFKPEVAQFEITNKDKARLVVNVKRIGNKVAEIFMRSPDGVKEDLTAEGYHAELQRDEKGKYKVTLTVPNDPEKRTQSFSTADDEWIGSKLIQDSSTQVFVILKGSGRQVLVTVDSEDSSKLESAIYVDTKEAVENDGWVVEVQSPEMVKKIYATILKKEASEVNEETDWRVVLYKEKFRGVLQGDFGRSIKYDDKVIDMMLSRVPVSLYFGILSTLILYAVCIPLGIVKAIHHRSLLDNVTSILIFIGYSIPGFALGAILLIYLGVQNSFFPLFGLVSENFENLSPWQKFIDLTHHTVLPLLAYIVGGFAVMTMMMKNNLMDNLATDYVRTAVSKGVSFKTAVFKHAFKNSFIPIAAGLGGIITIFVGGSLLIETVFDIQGFGLLSFKAIQGRDQTLIMGIISVSAFLMMVGNIISDLIVASIDPRVKFN